MMNDPANPTPVKLGMDTAAAEYHSGTYLSWVESQPYVCADCGDCGCCGDQFLLVSHGP